MIRWWGRNYAVATSTQRWQVLLFEGFCNFSLFLILGFTTWNTCQMLPPSQPSNINKEGKHPLEMEQYYFGQMTQT